MTPCASYQIRNIARLACAGNAGNVFPRGRLQRKRSRHFRRMRTRNFTYLARGLCVCSEHVLGFNEGLDHFRVDIWWKYKHIFMHSERIQHCIAFTCSASALLSTSRWVVLSPVMRATLSLMRWTEPVKSMWSHNQALDEERTKNFWIVLNNGPRLARDTLGNPFAYPGINITHLSVIYVENVHFDWFKQYLYTGEHFQSDLDIFQFDFMFVKPHDVPPLLCFNVQTEMRFGVEQLLFTTLTLWKHACMHAGRQAERQTDRQTKVIMELLVTANNKKCMWWNNAMMKWDNFK